MIVSTGSGSSGLLKNVHALTLERLERIAQLLGHKTSRDKLEQSLEVYNQSVIFDPSKPILHFFHRDMIDESGQQKQGEVQSVFVKNHTYKAVLCCDTEEVFVSFEDELEIMLCDEAHYLTTLHVTL